MQQLDAIGQPVRVQVQGISVEQQVEAGELQGALRHVGAGDVIAVAQQMHQLQSATGADVQRGFRFLAVRR